MKIAVLFASLIFFQGCATLKSDVFEHIKVGDSKQSVQEYLGEPTTFEASNKFAGGTTWYYSEKGDLCGFTFQGEVLVEMGCGADPNYRSPGKIAGAFLRGFGDGMASANRNQINCTTTGYGNFASTSCR